MQCRSPVKGADSASGYRGNNKKMKSDVSKSIPVFLKYKYFNVLNSRFFKVKKSGINKF